eukprot:SAG31_NODE_403_length_16150_cov_12.566588_19_plen_148_part_00
MVRATAAVIICLATGACCHHERTMFAAAAPLRVSTGGVQRAQQAGESGGGGTPKDSDGHYPPNAAATDFTYSTDAIPAKVVAMEAKLNAIEASLTTKIHRQVRCSRGILECVGRKTISDMSMGAFLLALARARRSKCNFPLPCNFPP